MGKKITMEELTGGNEEDRYNQFVNNDNRETNDVISYMAINELLNKKKLKSISRLKPEQVTIATKLYMFSSMFGDNFTKSLADYILELQISVNGLGRKEMVSLVQQRSDFGDMLPQRKQNKDIFR